MKTHSKEEFSYSCIDELMDVPEIQKNSDLLSHRSISCAGSQGSEELIAKTLISPNQRVVRIHRDITLSDDHQLYREGKHP
jgi:hypothetical protein